MRKFSILDLRFSIVAAIAIGLTSALGQTIGFRAAKDAPVFCKYVPRPEKCPPPFGGFAVPVYVKSPDRDFWMLGELMMNGAWSTQDTALARQNALTEVAAAAKQRGADAIWLVTPFEGRYCQAIVMKWVK